jgi:hypothetical protein
MAKIDKYTKKPACNRGFSGHREAALHVMVNRNT